MFCTLGVPQPWCTRVRSTVAPVKGYWLAVLTSRALAVAACGRLANTSRRSPGAPAQTPSAHIWDISPAVPPVIGVAPLVPPELREFAPSLLRHVVEVRVLQLGTARLVL